MFKDSMHIDDLINEYWGKQKVTLATRQTEYQKHIAV